MFKLKYSQKLPISLNEAWDFLSSPNNLELITPKSMDFNITDWDEKKAYPGQIIQYTVKPLLGVKITWVTEITQVKDKEFFKWRYLNSPFKKDYVFYILKKKERIHLTMIVRKIQKENGLNIRIVDFFGYLDDNDAILELLNKLISDSIKDS